MKRFLSLFDGTFYEPLNAFRKLERQPAKEQRKLTGKTKKSRNRYKQQAKVTRLHIRIASARKDYLHKTSTEVSKNRAVVVREDLTVANMSRSAKGTVEAPGRNISQKSGLSKAILDQGWGEFRLICTACGFEANADQDAAINIERAGHAQSACQANGAVMPSAAGNVRDAA